MVYDGNYGGEGSGDDVTEFTYNEMNELTGITHPDTSTETLTYDNNGNLTQTINNTTGETTAYEWDCFDRLTKVTLPAKGGATSGETVEFEYDSGGMLIGEKSAGMERKFTQQNRFATREVIKNGQDEWETSAMHVIHGTMLATYIGATSRRFGGKKQISHDTKTIFYHTDHLGSVRLIMDSHGNVVSSSTTDAYGNPLPGATAQPNLPPGSPKNKGAKMLSEFNFIGTHGIRYVEKVKLHNMRARWYNNTFRRFTSKDILKHLNRYNYVDNEPTNSIDSSGQSKEYQNISKRKTILQTLYNKYIVGPSPLSCSALVGFAETAKEVLLSKVKCPDFDDFVDILATMVVYDMGDVPDIPGVNVDLHWYPTMYPSTGFYFEVIGTLQKQFALGRWQNKGFKPKFQDTEGSFDQAHHYLAYSYMVYFFSRKFLNISLNTAIKMSATAVWEHEWRKVPYNKGDLRLGMRGVRTGAFFYNFWRWHMNTPFASQRREQLELFIHRVIDEIETVCDGRPDHASMEAFYVPAICHGLEAISFANI